VVSDAATGVEGDFVALNDMAAGSVKPLSEFREIPGPAAANALTALRTLRIDRGVAPRRAAWPSRAVWLGVVAAIAAGVAIGAALIFRSAPEVQTVRATLVGSEQADASLVATGYIVAHHKIDLNSKVTGRVKWIGVEKGDRVQAGQVLVELEDEEFKAQRETARGQVEAAQAYLRELQTGLLPEEVEQARLTLEEARATLTNDRVSLQRTRQLSERGLVARQQLDDAQARYEADQQRVDGLAQAYALKKRGPRLEEIQRAEGSLLQAQGQLAYADAQLAATRILAPVTGTILDRTAEKGEVVTTMLASGVAGGPVGSVVALANLEDLQVELDVAQDQFARLRAHQRATITTDAYPDRVYGGALTEVSPQANRQKATVLVKVQVERADGYLRPDMNATVRFITDSPSGASDASSGARRPGGVLVPVNAIRTDRATPYVLVAARDRAVARTVRTISTRGDQFVVEGLTGGEDVIVNSPATVKEGSRIKLPHEGAIR